MLTTGIFRHSSSVALQLTQQNFSAMTASIKDHWKTEKDRYQKFDSQPGIVRVVRYGLLTLRLACIPGMLVHFLLNKTDQKKRAKRIDLYVFLKFVIVMLLLLNYNTIKAYSAVNSFVHALLLYNIIETLIFIATPIYCTSSFAKPQSYKRAFTLVIINYFELLLCFAYLYAYCNGLKNSDTSATFTVMDYLYYSILSGFTMGSGDITAASEASKQILTCQEIVFFFFVTVFINYNFNKTS